VSDQKQEKTLEQREISHKNNSLLIWTTNQAINKVTRLLAKQQTK